MLGIIILGEKFIIIPIIFVSNLVIQDDVQEQYKEAFQYRLKLPFLQDIGVCLFGP